MTEYKQQTHFIQDSEEDVYTMYHLSREKKKSFKAEIVLGGLKTMIEIDTGALKTILSETTYKRLRDALGPLRETKVVLSMYTGERIPIVGEALIPVNHEDQQHNLKAIVVQGSGLNLLGRDWLQVIQLVWSQILHTSSPEPHSALENIHAKYADVFTEELGTLKGIKAKLYVDPEAQPKYVKARSVPYSLKKNVELELERLERKGIISLVEFFQNGQRPLYQSQNQMEL